MIENLECRMYLTGYINDKIFIIDVLSKLSLCERPYYEIYNNLRTVLYWYIKFVCLQITSSFLVGEKFLYHFAFVFVILSRLQMSKKRLINIPIDCYKILFYISSFFPYLLQSSNTLIKSTD